jgi:transcriptional regulator with XRE-family HTH domain
MAVEGTETMNQVTIRSELEDYLRGNTITINQFSEISGINSGTISNILNGNRPISMLQLDRITTGMGLTEGYFYELYVEECFNLSTLNWRRLSPLLYRCADLNRLDCIKQVVGGMMDKLTYAPALFDVAEDLYGQGKNSAAALIYEGVAESEKYQHSERLALCQYRLFKIALDSDQEVNYRAAVQFESYVDRLDEIDQLDALKDLANTYSSLRHWDKVDHLSKEMGRKASIQYKFRYEKSRKTEGHKEPTLPLFAYIMYSYVLCGAVCIECRKYEEALHYISLYSDMSWVCEKSKKALEIMDKFKVWAEANTYLYKILKGDLYVISDYITYIEKYKDETLPALFMIIQAANKYRFDIDEILIQFESEILSYRERNWKIETYNQRVIEDRYVLFMYELAAYYIEKKEYKKSIKYLLDSLDLSVKINSENCIIKCVILFEQVRHVVGVEIEDLYKTLMSEVKRKNEKKNNYFISYI